MTRIWQSMLHHSDAGRFENAHARPNGICTALCLEITRQVVAGSPLLQPMDAS